MSRDNAHLRQLPNMFTNHALCHAQLCPGTAIVCMVCKYARMDMNIFLYAQASFSSIVKVGMHGVLLQSGALKAISSTDLLEEAEKLTWHHLNFLPSIENRFLMGRLNA